MAGSGKTVVSKQELGTQLVVALAGRAAEELHLGRERTAGASGDLEQATSIARMMVEALGMTNAGFATVRGDRNKVYAAIEELLTNAHKKAHEILKENAKLLEAVAVALLDQEDLDLDDLADLEDRHPVA